MNERIKELAREAGGGLSCIAEPLEHPWKFSQSELEKFAELIVRECIECADFVGQVNIALDYPNSTANHVKQKIKQHFGVEE